MTPTRKNSQELFDLFKKHFEDEEKKRKDFNAEASKPDVENVAAPPKKPKPRKVISASPGVAPAPTIPKQGKSQAKDKPRPATEAKTPVTSEPPPTTPTRKYIQSQPPPAPTSPPAPVTTPTTPTAHTLDETQDQDDTLDRAGTATGKLTITLNNQTIALGLMAVILLCLGFFATGVKVGKRREIALETPISAPQAPATAAQPDNIGYYPQPPRPTPPAIPEPDPAPLSITPQKGNWTIVLQTAPNANKSRNEFEKLIDKLRNTPGVPTREFELFYTQNKKHVMLGAGRFDTSSEAELKKMKTWFAKLKVSGYRFTDCYPKKIQ